MGEGSRRRQRFLADHPKCCFCGGDEESSTSDHLPPRAMFTGRSWPEGFEFPACEECNARTRGIEQVVSLYAFMSEKNPTPTARAQFQKLVRGVRNNNPQMLPNPIVSAIEKKAFLRRIGGKLPDTATTDDLHLARFPSGILDKFVPFACKLFCARYYKELSAIFPSTGAITLTLTTSTYLKQEQMDWFIKNLAGSRPTKRGNRDITPEFSYRYESGEDGKLFAHIAHLRGHLVWFLGGVTDRSLIGDHSNELWYDVFGNRITGP